jgi:hypothetical protein
MTREEDLSLAEMAKRAGMNINEAKFSFPYVYDDNGEIIGFDKAQIERKKDHDN